MRLACLLMLLAPTGFSQSTGFGGMIIGKIVGNDGSAVGAAWVTITREPKSLLEKETIFTTGGPAQPDGTFAFSGLAPGSYHLCASHRGTNWLDSCEWSGPAPAIKLAKDQIVRDFPVLMKKGTALKIRLNDSTGSLSQNEKKTPGAHVLIGIVTARGSFLPLDISADDARGHDYVALVPEGAEVEVVVRSDFFEIDDNAGRAVGRSAARFRITATKGQAAAPLTLSVTGVNPEKLSSK